MCEHFCHLSTHKTPNCMNAWWLINTQRGQGLSGCLWMTCFWVSDTLQWLCHHVIIFCPTLWCSKLIIFSEALIPSLLYFVIFLSDTWFFVVATSLVDSPIQVRVAVLITKLGSLSSAVLQCWGCLVSSSLHPLTTGYSGYPPARNIEISDLQSDHALPPARSWDRVLLISNCC